jgi:chemotaxis protein histidine kinase CheA/ActR/RegA family two-component response regulator
MANNFDKFAILDSFLDEVRSYLPEIGANLDRLQQRPDDKETVEETYRRTHTIAGSSAMMEFTGMAHVAQGMEDILGEAIDSQAPIDAPTIGLLRRALSRLERLVDNIRTEADDAPIIAEDDADRAAWRGSAAGMPEKAAGAEPAIANGAGPATDSMAGAAQGGIPVPDWLAAFAGSGPSAPAAETSSPPSNGVSEAFGRFAGSGPSAAAQPAASGAGDGRDPWGQSISTLPTGYTPAVPQTPASESGNGHSVSGPGATSVPPFGFGEPEESLDEILQAFHASAAQSVDAAPPVAAEPAPQSPPSWAASAPSGFDVSAVGTSALPAMPPTPPTPLTPPAQPARPLSPQPASPATPLTPAPRAGQPQPDLFAVPTQPPGSGPQALLDVRMEEEAVRRQVATLRDVAASLREAAQAMEDERSELRTFLNGTRDALDRLEEWAGIQMGLDLRSSPDSVRRYLPLSVIWVITTRLKKLVGLLHGSSRDLTTTQEQIEETLNGLHAALDELGPVYGAMSSIAGSPQSGFTATVAQFAWSPPQTAPSYPSESLPRVRADESALSPGARAEVERDVRQQLRRELEDDVRAEVAAEVRREEEDRLRQELQIQVRRQLLAELSPGGGIGSGALAGERERGIGPLAHMRLSEERAPKPVQITSELSPEALEVFREEAQEHLQTITSGIAQLEQSASDIGVLRSIRRAMHTLKGAAGMMGFVSIQQIAHASEDLLDRFVEQGISMTPEAVSLLLDTSEALDQLVTGAVADPEEQQRLAHTLSARYAQLTGHPVEESAPAAGAGAADGAHLVQADEAEPTTENAGGKPAQDLSVRLQLSKLDDLVTLFGELLVNRSILEERIDRLSRIVGDTVVVSERLREVGGQLETRFEAATLPSGRGPAPGSGRPAAHGGGGWAQGLGRIISGGLQAPEPETASEFDELELDRYTEFHRLSRGLSEGVADVVTLSHEMESIIRETQASFARENRLTSDFQDRLLKARLVPLSSLVPRLYRTARASALREGKEIEFFAEGMDTEVDRKVFEEVMGPLLHLVRNAVNHGIERPNVREVQGKARAGRILVSAAYEGNQVVISVRDDGAGIDPDRVRETAVSRGWIDPYTQLSEKDAINLIFRQGVSTADSITEESGRGVGLDVVRDSVTRLRGTIEVDSGVGKGTVFTMKFPISLQIARAVLVRVGTQSLAIPMAVVDQIGRLDYYQRVPGPVPAVELQGERYPLAHLASYLKLQPGRVDERASVLLVNAGKRRVALLVDDIVAQQEIVSKPLGPHLRDVPGVAGAAVLGNGQVVLILELHELLAQQPRGSVVLPEPGARPAGSMAAPLPERPTGPVPAYGRGAPPSVTAPTAAVPGAPAAAPAGRGAFAGPPRPMAGSVPGHVVVPPAAQGSYVLVVDDSPSVRRVVSNMLKANGWEVQTARDGVEALEVIARQMPAAALLDIEMPRMDGYELMATIRSQEQYRQLPLIVLTSRAATKHQQRALQLGADAYVVKPYQDEELLNTIATLVQARR